MDKTFVFIKQYLYAHIGGEYQAGSVALILLGGIVLTAVAAYFACKWLLYFLGVVISKTPTRWDDDLLGHNLMRAASQLAPAIVVNRMLPAFFRAGDGHYVHWISLLTSLYILWAVVRIVVIFLGNLYATLSRRKNMQLYAVKGIFQMLKLLVVGVGVIIAVSLMIGKEPGVVLTALGASAAVLMLVFKDTILGLVASVQLTANKMLRKGDWIVADKYGANGEVEDVSLTTVKVRNWDNSISTIPPYALVSESFRNYQPMRIAGGRRVDRSLYIDMSSVRFCTEDELRELDSRGWLEGVPLDRAARQVNLTLFRRYLEKYISLNKDVNQTMLHMVRQMDPTQSGLPLQLYFFVKKTGWKDFEHIQADIFDHVYAVIGVFGLRVFQTPTGTDIGGLSRTTTF